MEHRVEHAQCSAWLTAVHETDGVLGIVLSEQHEAPIGGRVVAHTREGRTYAGRLRTSGPLIVIDPVCSLLGCTVQIPAGAVTRLVHTTAVFFA